MNVNDLFPKKWLAPDDLAGRSVLVEILAVSLEEVLNPRTRQTERKLAVSFKGARKRLLLNRTQAFAIAAVCASPHTEQWAGCRLVLSSGIAPNRQPTIVVSGPPTSAPAAGDDADAQQDRPAADALTAEAPAAAAAEAAEA